MIQHSLIPADLAKVADLGVVVRVLAHDGDVVGRKKGQLQVLGQRAVPRLRGRRKEVSVLQI